MRPLEMTIIKADNCDTLPDFGTLEVGEYYADINARLPILLQLMALLAGNRG